MVTLQKFQMIIYASGVGKKKQYFVYGRLFASEASHASRFSGELAALELHTRHAKNRHTKHAKNRHIRHAKNRHTRHAKNKHSRHAKIN